MTAIVGAVAPVARAARVQLTDTLAVAVHVQPAPAAETKVTPAGRVSVTWTLAASEGPLFATTSPYATVPSAATVGGPVLVIDRSAEAVTAVSTEAVLLAGLGSAVVAATDAVLDREPAWGGAVTTTVIVGALVPVVREEREHVTETFALLVQAHPAPPAETKATPAGSTSTTERFPASDGPASVTARW